MMPEDGRDQLRTFEAVYLGAVGYPGVPDHVSLWGLLIPIRRGFRQYIARRPVRLLKGARSPLAGRRPRGLAIVVIRADAGRAPGAARQGRPLAAGRPRAERHRHGDHPGEQRRGVFGDWRTPVSRY